LAKSTEAKDTDVFVAFLRCSCSATKSAESKAGRNSWYLSEVRPNVQKFAQRGGSEWWACPNL